MNDLDVVTDLEEKVEGLINFFYSKLVVIERFFLCSFFSFISDGWLIDLILSLENYGFYFLDFIYSNYICLLYFKTHPNFF